MKRRALEIERDDDDDGVCVCVCVCSFLSRGCARRKGRRARWGLVRGRVARDDDDDDAVVVVEEEEEEEEEGEDSIFLSLSLFSLSRERF